MSDSGNDQPQEGDPPPFTPEQMQWIDPIIAGRLQPPTGPPSSGDSGDSRIPTTLATPASLPGKQAVGEDSSRMAVALGAAG